MYGVWNMKPPALSLLYFLFGAQEHWRGADHPAWRRGASYAHVVRWLPAGVAEVVLDASGVEVGGEDEAVGTQEVEEVETFGLGGG